MRKFVIHILTAAVVTGAPVAQAADLDYGVLRGPDEDVYIPPVDWSGVYLGGHGGYSTGNTRVGKDLQSYSATAVNGLGYVLNGPAFVPPSTRVRETTFGAFAGYNLQLDDTVVGIEADYTHSQMRGRANDAVAVTNLATGLPGIATRQTTSTVTDYGTIRARAGYAIGSLLPFATAGLAIARLEDTNAVPNIALPGGAIINGPAARTSERYTFGFTVGAGIDFALTNNIVLRGEYQYVKLDNFRSSSVRNTVEINTFRGGAAIKF